MTTSEHDVEGIPVLAAVPPGHARGIAVWLSHLGGSAAKTSPELERLADAGWFAVSYDPPGHGRRSTGDPWQFAATVLGSFRRLMWPLLGRTTLEGLRVVDWAQQRAGIDGPVVAGGVSMGGDVSVALAGIDPRVHRVCALAATPDWTRPHMRPLDDPGHQLSQGHADTYAQWFRNAVDPTANLDRYRRRDLAIAFHNGSADHHVPADDAMAFRDALACIAPDAAERITVTVHDGAGHLDVDERFLDPGLTFLTHG
jgi:pimeloyl-ACP methyl ester carboxylesterase